MLPRTQVYASSLLFALPRRNTSRVATPGMSGLPQDSLQKYTIQSIVCKASLCHQVIMLLCHHVIFAEFIGHDHLHKYVVKHKSAKLYAVGKLEAALNISH